MVVPGSRESHAKLIASPLAPTGAAAAVLVVWAGRFFVEPVLGGASPLLPFTFSVSVAAYFGGLGRHLCSPSWARWQVGPSFPAYP